ncbi:MAG: mannose-1-phosphate guanylyltransferase [Muribaculaceae bacterium]|nr:mannose-1-phosphate guanylyltransferase [Muribaculaceae bacterium]
MRYCVIMCGGVGSRFWPFSREEKPKQFLDFFGTGRSLLQATFDRVLEVVPAERILLVTNRRYEPLVREQLPEVPADNILLEPARRNTAPCICWSARNIFARDPEASIVTLPSDHLVLKEVAFHTALRRGFEFVEKGDRLLTLGLRPTSPATGYGYIQQGAPVADLPDFFKVRSFTEKPNEELAKVFLASGEFFWNAGIFLWTAKSILKAFEEYDPETLQVFNAGLDLFGTPAEKDFIEKNFVTAPSNSIDYAIMEKASNVYVETVDLGWSDLGSWKALYEASPHDANGNVTQNCRVLQHNCRDTLFAVDSDDRIIVASGLEDYVVASAGNAILICPVAEEQRIRQVVNDVKDRFGEDFV